MKVSLGLVTVHEMKIQEFLDLAWKRYTQITPDAAKIAHLLQERGENVINDHIAFRTFNRKGLGRNELGQFFQGWGYSACEDLIFEEKKLKATYYTHPDETLPKIFISELILENFSQDLQNWVGSLTTLRANTAIGKETFLESSWGPVSFTDYNRFYFESEYAAWTAAFGIQVNHFTVLVNGLKSFKGIYDLNEFLLKEGFTLNASGGLVKGIPSDLLEQSSTMAIRMPVQFREALREIPSCYYEFAQRYPVPGEGKLFQGFLPKNANKIFESTHRLK